MTSTKCVHINIFACKNNEKKNMNLKESKEDYVEGFEGYKGKGEMI